MLSLSRFVAAGVLPVVCLAQQPPSPAAPGNDAVTALRQNLRDTAAGGPTAFDVRWQPAVSPGALGTKRPKPELESAKGSFGPDWLLVELQGGEHREWLQVGRHTATRSKGDAWQLSGPRQMSGAGTDVPLLLRALAATTSAVVARSIVDRGGNPVEQFTVCLDTVQADALIFAGAMFEPSPAQIRARSMAKSGHADAKDVPVSVIDVCVDVDVATHQVQRIQVRAMCKDVPMQHAGPVPRRPAAEEVPDPKVDSASAVPAQFKDGLPVRDENKMQVVWVEVVLREHGKAAAVVLDDTQKVLLGR
jgi:hypothetical protein